MWRVETLIQRGALSIERSIYAQRQNWCSKHVYEVYEVYMYIAKNFCHEGTTVSPFLFAVVFMWGSYLATTVSSASVVSLHNVTFATGEHSRRLHEVDH